MIELTTPDLVARCLAQCSLYLRAGNGGEESIWLHHAAAPWTEASRTVTDAMRIGFVHGLELSAIPKGEASKPSGNANGQTDSDRPGIRETVLNWFR